MCARIFWVVWLVGLILWTTYVSRTPQPPWVFVFCGVSIGAGAMVLLVQWAVKRRTTTARPRRSSATGKR